MINYLVAALLSFSFFQSHEKHDIPPTAAFVIEGMVKHEQKFNIGDLEKFPQDSLGDIIIRNKRGEEKSAARHMKGILLKTLVDSAGIPSEKPKDYSEVIIVLTASDGYKNVYSWNELFNTDIGNHVYVITEMDGRPMHEMPDRILVLSLSDINSGRRHLKGLAKIDVRRVL